MSDTSPVPGWYQDASDARLMRWWDGVAWTEHTQPTPDAPPPPSDDAPAFSLGSASASASGSGSGSAGTVGVSSDFLSTTPQANPGQSITTLTGSAPGSRRERRALESGTSVASNGSTSSTSFPTSNGSSASSGASPTTDSMSGAAIAAAAASTESASTATASAEAKSRSTNASSTDSGSVDLSEISAPSTSPVVGAAPGLVTSDGTPPPGITLPSTGSQYALTPARTGPTGVVVFGSTPLGTAPLGEGMTAVPDLPSWDPMAGAPKSRPATASVASVASAAVPAVSVDDIDHPWADPDSFAVPQSKIVLASSDFAPMELPPSPRSAGAPPPPPSRSGTVGAWMLALLPWLQLGLLVVIFVYVLGGAAVLSTGALPTEVSLDAVTLIPAAAALGLLIWIIVAVIVDRVGLKRHGFSRRPSFWWILLGPLIYLIARTVSVMRGRGRGGAPLWVYLLSSLSVAALVIAAPFLVPRQASVDDMRAVEDQLSADLASEGLDYEVFCPDSADARIGSVFVCDAIVDGSVEGLITVRWAGIDGSVEYWVELGSSSTDASS